MPKVARELSAQAVARLREIGDHAVGGVPGLFLRVAENSRHWCFRYSLQGQRRLMGLGSYPSVSLATAHRPYRLGTRGILLLVGGLRTGF